MITIGQTYRFAYPTAFVNYPEYSQHRDLPVRVLRQCTDQEYCPEDAGELMFKIEASDGWQGDAWESELQTIA